MFESVTKRRKNPLINLFGWSLLAVCCVVFVFIGFSPNNSFLGSGGAAAEVNGDAISLRDYKEILDRLDNNQGPSDRDSQRKMRENAINILVSRSLIVQEADDLNIHVGDKEVAQALMDIEPFYVDGVFSRSQYARYLRGARLSESEFEDKIRRDLVIQKMSNLIGFVAKDISLVDDFDEKIDQAQINVGYVRINPSSVKGADQKSVEQFLTEKQADVQEYYNSHKSEFATAEQVKARHILVKAKDKTDKAMEEALKKMKEITAGLTTDNFSDMAKKHSDDPGSKTRGGDLGFFPRGRMVPEFEKAAFESEIGKITEPVKTQYGYHVLLVDEKKSASEKTLDEVKNQIAKKLQAKEGYDVFLASLKEKLKSQSYGEIEELLSKNNLKWTNTGFFSITKENVPGVGSSKEFLDVAMKLGAENEYADQLVYSGDNAYLLKFKGAKMTPASNANNQMAFFKQLMKQQKANMMVQSWTNALRAKASVKVNPDLVR